MKGKKREIVVDGVIYPSATAAAPVVGCTPQNLLAVIKNGGGKVNGHEIHEAEEIDRVMMEIKERNAQPYQFTNR